MATTGYQAAPESNDVLISYGLETVWKTAPAVQFQAVRMTGEGLTGSKTRQRPPEVKTDGQVSAAVTMQETATGPLNFALSFLTYDDLLAMLFGSTWSAQLSIVGVAGDITITSGTNVISSTTAGKFTNIVLGQWIKTSGFVNGANNGYARVTTYTDNQHITVTGLTPVTETPAAAAAHIDGSMLRNGTVFQSAFIQKKLATAQYLTYPGSMAAGGNLNSQQGQFVQGSINFIAAQQLKATSDSSTGAVLAAPTNPVMDTLAIGFQLLTMNGATIAAVCKGFDFQITRQGAAAEYGVGSNQAQGVIRGLFELAGKADFYFKDFTQYDLYTAESLNNFSHLKKDGNGHSYMFTVPAGSLMNPQVVASGPNQPVMASFTLEGNPDTTTGCTMQIDRFT